MTADQHASLAPERWAAFTREQQLLMIANELHRAGKLVEPGDGERRRGAYARVLKLSDLTVAAHPARGFRRELLRWRDLVAALYLDGAPSPVAHRAALRSLLRLSYESAKQVPYLDTPP